MQDKNFAYREGDKFPREGLDVSQKRIDELLSENNKRGKPLIKKVEEKPKKKKANSEEIAK